MTSSSSSTKRRKTTTAKSSKWIWIAIITKSEDADQFPEDYTCYVEVGKDLDDVLEGMIRYFRQEWNDEYVEEPISEEENEDDEALQSLNPFNPGLVFSNEQVLQERVNDAFPVDFIQQKYTIRVVQRDCSGSLQ